MAHERKCIRVTIMYHDFAKRALAQHRMNLIVGLLVKTCWLWKYFLLESQVFEHLGK